jgi:hypothetical protein
MERLADVNEVTVFEGEMWFSFQVLGEESFDGEETRRGDIAATVDGMADTDDVGELIAGSASPSYRREMEVMRGAPLRVLTRVSTARRRPCSEL